jgi:hypothetical protein
MKHWTKSAITIALLIAVSLGDVYARPPRGKLLSDITRQQVAEAAADPTKLAALLDGLTPQQAAQLTSTVLVQAAVSNPTALSALTQGALSIIPENSRSSFVSTLGSELGGNPTLASRSSAIVAIANAIQSNTSMVGTFATSYNSAVQSSINANREGDLNTGTTLYVLVIQPPAGVTTEATPTITVGYAGQQT